MAVITAYKPWGVYYAGNYSENKLFDMLNRSDRTAITTGIINPKTSSGNGANGTIKSIMGTTTTTIEWTANSIPNKYTICSITRYTGDTNNKRILTARNATSSNDWVHGHKNGKRGVVYYGEFKTNSSPELNLKGNNTDWVVTCAKNDGNIPNNIYINGVPSGLNTGGRGELKLAINKFDDNSIINEQSEFALSYVIIWDSTLSDNALKIVSDALMNYLNTGEDLLFDTSNLTIDDKVKVIDAKSNFFKEELVRMKEENDRLQSIKENDRLQVSNQESSSLTSAPAQPSASDIEKQQLYARIANMESAIKGQTNGTTASSTNVINLNTQIDNTNKSCVNFQSMPEPIESSFTDNFDNVSIDSTIINNTTDSSYLWCNKCDFNKSDECIAYDSCRKWYSDVKSDYTNDGLYVKKKTDNEIDANKEAVRVANNKDKYTNCSGAFINFPKIK